MSEIIQRLKRIVDSGEDAPIVLEIGCCEGTDTLNFLNIFESIRLFCFECDPKNCDDHRNLVDDPRCQLIEAAIADKNEDIIFHRSGGRNRRASGSIRIPKDHLRMHPWCTFSEDLIVKGITLDTWCEQNGIDHVDLMWCDVNGGESAMIAGAQKIFRNTRYIYTEFGSDKYEIYEGGISKDQIKALLPNFEEILIHTNNVLLKNTELS